MRLLTTALIAGLLLTSCSGSGTPPPSPGATTTPTTATDPFEALTPPTSPGVGAYDAVLANRAYQASQGLLALQLLEAPTLLGSNDAELATQLQGALKDPSIPRDLRGATRRGLDYRPRFPKGTTLANPVGSVVSSVYVGEEVQGLGGEHALRIRWSGTVTYPVTFQGRTHTVTYSLTMAYVFSPLPQEPNGLALQQAVPGTGTADGVVTACVAKGLLYPGPAAGRCPV
jgi:hypothetical protein